MQIKIKDALISEILRVFPSVDMPSSINLVLDAGECSECDHVADDLEEYRNKEVSRGVIALLHQELAHLSPQAWLWVLPFYLLFSLSEDGLESTETEYLIYFMARDINHHKDVVRGFSLLSREQISCLIKFLNWCSEDQYWKEYAPENISNALSNLKTLLLTKN